MQFCWNELCIHREKAVGEKWREGVWVDGLAHKSRWMQTTQTRVELYRSLQEPLAQLFNSSLSSIMGFLSLHWFVLVHVLLGSWSCTATEDSATTTEYHRTSEIKAVLDDKVNSDIIQSSPVSSPNNVRDDDKSHPAMGERVNGSSVFQQGGRFLSRKEDTIVRRKLSTTTVSSSCGQASGRVTQWSLSIGFIIRAKPGSRNEFELPETQWVFDTLLPSPVATPEHIYPDIPEDTIQILEEDSDSVQFQINQAWDEPSGLQPIAVSKDKDTDTDVPRDEKVSHDMTDGIIVTKDSRDTVSFQSNPKRDHHSGLQPIVEDGKADTERTPIDGADSVDIDSQDLTVPKGDRVSTTTLDQTTSPDPDEVIAKQLWPSTGKRPVIILDFDVDRDVLIVPHIPHYVGKDDVEYVWEHKEDHSVVRGSFSFRMVLSSCLCSVFNKE